MEEDVRLRSTLRQLDSQLDTLARRRGDSQAATAELLREIREELFKCQQQLAVQAAPAQGEGVDAAAARAGLLKLQSIASRLGDVLERDRAHGTELQEVARNVQQLQEAQVAGLAYARTAELAPPGLHEKEVSLPEEEIADPCVAARLPDVAAVLAAHPANGMPQQPTLPTGGEGGYSTTLHELFVEDTPSLVFRLGFPSTSSTHMREKIVTAGRLTAEERLPRCPAPVVVGCGDVREGALATFQRTSGNLTTLADTGQHLALGRKRKSVEAQVEEHGFKPEPVEVTMLREPAQYAQRVFADRAPTARTFKEEKAALGFATITHQVLHFDQPFEALTNCSLEVATIDQWIDLAYWRWNYFTRGLADDYRTSLWLKSLREWSRTREEEWAVNLQGGSSSLLKTALENLHKMAFFGIYDRLEESMELFAFTLCADFENLGFELQEAKRVLPARAHTLRGADAVGEDTYELLRSRNRLDYLLFEYAEQLFDRRLEAMRQAKELGFRCKQSDSTCGILC